MVNKLDAVGISSDDGRLSVEFRWQEDRFTQRILLDGREVARSVEGDASQSWPPSPPLQQLSLERIHGVETILAVGAAGQTHFSLSAAIDGIGGAAPSVRFDLAARCKAESAPIQSTYRIADSITVEVERGEIRFVSADRNPWREVVIYPRSVDSDTPTAATPVTWRWSYRVASSE